MLPGRNQTGMNLKRYNNFSSRLQEPGRNAWCQPGFWTKSYLLYKKKKTYIADPKAYKLKISGPGLKFVVTYLRTVRIHTGTRDSCLGPAAETKSDRSEFIVRPVSCKRKKRECMEADTMSSRSEFFLVSCKYPKVLKRVDMSPAGSKRRTR